MRRLGDRVGPLCQHKNCLPLAQFQFGAVVKGGLHAAGLLDQHYETHSFHIGAASTAAGLSFSPAELQRLGCWRSSAYCAYVQ